MLISVAFKTGDLDVTLNKSSGINEDGNNYTIFRSSIVGTTRFGGLKDGYSTGEIDSVCADADLDKNLVVTSFELNNQMHSWMKDLEDSMAN